MFFLLSVVEIVWPMRQRGRMRFIFLALMVAVCGFSALAEDDYFPMHVGDEWTYSITSSELYEKGVAYVKIEGTNEREGKTYFRNHSWWKGNPSQLIPETETLFRKDREAVFCILGSTEKLALVLPLKVAATWHNTIGAIAIVNTVVGLETIELSGKSYNNCYHIRTVRETDNTLEDLWLAPNIGTIKTITTYSFGRAVTATLMKFKPGK
jgi:hypothetical protein